MIDSTKMFFRRLAWAGALMALGLACGGELDEAETSEELVFNIPPMPDIEVHGTLFWYGTAAFKVYNDGTGDASNVALVSHATSGSLFSTTTTTQWHFITSLPNKPALILPGTNSFYEKTITVYCPAPCKKVTLTALSAPLELNTSNNSATFSF